jgi:TRAP-type mannitol/chloroaromatic compound transport system substrate-binding protein
LKSRNRTALALTVAHRADPYQSIIKGKTETPMGGFIKMTDEINTRRRFLKTGTAAVAGTAAAVAMPNIARAQEASVWKFQSTWPAKDIFHEFAADFVQRVNDMGGGRLKFELLAAGSVAKALEVHDAVLSGTLDGGHGVTAYWYGKHKAGAPTR